MPLSALWPSHLWDLADSLPEHLLVKVFSSLLLEPPHRAHNPFGEASAALHTALVLACTCRVWRQAAAQATQALQLALNMREARAYLSPLLGELVAGCRGAKLHAELFAASSALSFLDMARPTTLEVYGTGKDAYGRAGAFLASAAGCRRCSAQTAYYPLPGRRTCRSWLPHWGKQVLLELSALCWPACRASCR